jgi:hypothetical protein
MVPILKNQGLKKTERRVSDFWPGRWKLGTGFRLYRSGSVSFFFFLFLGCKKTSHILNETCGVRPAVAVAKKG